MELNINREPLTNFEDIYKMVFNAEDKEYYQEILNGQNSLVQSNRSIFVHGESLGSEIAKMNEAKFTKTIHENLFKHGYQAIFRVQAFSWNEICDGRSIAIVNSRKGGKTMAFLPPLLTLLSNNKKTKCDEELTSQGPIAVIITKTSSDVENLFQLCNQLLKNQEIKIVKAFGIWNFKSKCIELLNGCDLLITTPSCFTRFSQTDTLKIFDQKRIKHLVFENLDVMWEHSMNDITNVLNVCIKGIELLQNNPQIIITATRWQEYINVLLKLFYKPIIVIDSYIEAAIFAKSRFTVSRNTLSKKNKQLLNFVSQYEWRLKKTAILFSEIEEIEKFKVLLSRKAIGYEILDANTKQDDLEAWLQEKEGKMSLLLIHDDICTNYELECVQILIHYSLPTTWTAFSKRFALSLSYYKYYTNLPVKTKEREPWSIIVLDENNEVEIPRIMNFLSDRRLVKDIPEKIQNEVQKIQENIEKAKVDGENEIIVPLCTHVLKFGSCSLYKCKNRHVFIADDKPTKIPHSGCIKFKILGINSPLHYVIMITDHLPPNGRQWVSFRDKIQKIREKLKALQSHMKYEENHEMDVIKAGDIYAFFDTKTIKWRRCKLLRILELKEQYKPPNVEIEFIDVGGRLTVRSSLLLKLPDEIKELDPLACDLRVVNFVPCDHDDLFDSETIYAVEKFIKSAQANGNYMISGIEMALKSTIITTNFQLFQKLKNFKSDLMKFSLKSYLLKNNYAVEQQDIMERLKVIATSCKFDFPENLKQGELSFIEKSPKNNDIDEQKLNFKNLVIGKKYTAKLLYVESPDCFYIQISDENEKDLTEKLKAIEHSKRRDVLRDVAINKVCLFNSNDGKLLRSIIIQVEPLEIFAVDLGIKKKTNCSNLFEISKELINLIPFQAVECGIKGLKVKKMRILGNTFEFKKILNNVSTDGIFEVKIDSKINNKYILSITNSEKGLDVKNMALMQDIAELSEQEKHDEALKRAASYLANLLEDDENVNFNQRDANKMFNLPSTARFLPPKGINEILEKPYINAIETNPLKEILPTAPVRKVNLKLTDRVLKNIYPNVNITWNQNDDLVMLKVEAIDSVDYALKITDTHCEIFIKYSDKVALSIIELYGRIVPKYAVHKLRGHYITIILVKKFLICWPRLTILNEKNSFIKSCTDELKISFSDNNMADKPHIAVYPPAGFHSDNEESDDYDDAIENEEVI